MGGVLIKVGVAKYFARVYVKCPLNFQHLPTPMMCEKFLECQCTLQIYQKSGKGFVVMVYGTPATVNIIIL